MSDFATIALPLFLISVIISIFGLWRRRMEPVIGGAILALPVSFYLMQTSDIGVLAWLMPIGLAGSAWLIKQGRFGWAWVLWLPQGIILVLIGMALFAWQFLF
ncbi:hypothetical protein [Chloroflexus sp.]|uniref:hypothetical protein n=1 Tax=Chloroflexus sp. TaxID=1904827 RepID=UPI002601B72B|nr:hypothetical protein [uncultured Chloroflexus sp.]